MYSCTQCYQVTSADTIHISSKPINKKTWLYWQGFSVLYMHKYMYQIQNNNNNLKLEGEEDTVQMNVKYALKNFELKP